jgi:hypothetical protein
MMDIEIVSSREQFIYPGFAESDGAYACVETSADA